MKRENNTTQATIDDHLKANMDTLQNVPARNPHTAARGRARFLFQAQELRQAVSDGSKSRHNGWTIIPLWSRKEPVRMNILATILVIFSLVFGGASATVAAAQSSNPDQPLYGVKLASEEVRSQLVLKIQTRFELALQFANRRVAEFEKLEQKGINPAEALLARYQSQIQTAFQLAAGMPEEDVVPALLRLQQTLRLHEQTMLRLQDQDPDSPVLQRMRLMIQNRLQLAVSGIEDPLTFRKQLRSGQSEDFIPPQQEGQGTAGGNQNGGFPWDDEPPSPGSGYQEGNGNPWTEESPEPGSGFGQDGGNPWTETSPTPGSGYGDGNGDNPWTEGTPTPGSGYGDGNGDNPWTEGTPTPGSGYGDGNGDNPWAIGTPTPGSGYGPGGN